METCSRHDSRIWHTHCHISVLEIRRLSIRLPKPLLVWTQCGKMRVCMCFFLSIFAHRFDVNFYGRRKAAFKYIFCNLHTIINTINYVWVWAKPGKISVHKKCWCCFQCVEPSERVLRTYVLYRHHEKSVGASKSWRRSQQKNQIWTESLYSWK